MVNLQIHLQDIGKRVRLGRFWKIKKRENIFAYINSMDHYIWHYIELRSNIYLFNCVTIRRMIKSLIFNVEYTLSIKLQKTKTYDNNLMLLQKKFSHMNCWSTKIRNSIRFHEKVLLFLWLYVSNLYFVWKYRKQWMVSR